VNRVRLPGIQPRCDTRARLARRAAGRRGHPRRGHRRRPPGSQPDGSARGLTAPLRLDHRRHSRTWPMARAAARL
jgi:hypothetical protein